MWQEISESSSSRMVHFISWLSDLMLELRKWIIFIVLLPLGTQRQKANMHRGPGERTRGLGLARRSPAWTHTLVHCRPRHPGTTQPRDSSGDGRLRPHMPRSRSAEGGSLLLPLPLRSRASASRAPFSASASSARSCTSLRLGSLAEGAQSP